MSRLLSELAIFVLLTLGVPSAVSAHAKLTSSSPANGAVLDSAPGKVVLRFESEVEKQFARFSLERPDGTSRTLTGPSGDGVTTEMTVPLGALGKGEHRLRWSVVSRDGHRVEGVIRFTVDAE